MPSPDASSSPLTLYWDAAHQLYLEQGDDRPFPQCHSHTLGEVESIVDMPGVVVLDGPLAPSPDQAEIALQERAQFLSRLALAEGALQDGDFDAAEQTLLEVDHLQEFMPPELVERFQIAHAVATDRLEDA